MSADSSPTTSICFSVSPEKQFLDKENEEEESPSKPEVGPRVRALRDRIARKKLLEHRGVDDHESATPLTVPPSPLSGDDDDDDDAPAAPSTPPDVSPMPVPPAIASSLPVPPVAPPAPTTTAIAAIAAPAPTTTISSTRNSLPYGDLVTLLRVKTDEINSLNAQLAHQREQHRGRQAELQQQLDAQLKVVAQYVALDQQRNDEIARHVQELETVRSNLDKEKKLRASCTAERKEVESETMKLIAENDSRGEECAALRKEKEEEKAEFKRVLEEHLTNVNKSIALYEQEKAAHTLAKAERDKFKVCAERLFDENAELKKMVGGLSVQVNKSFAAQCYDSLASFSESVASKFPWVTQPQSK